MISQGMLFCILFTLSISICLFMYIHQKTSSIEKNIKNVLQFIHGIEKDVKNMNAQSQNINVTHEQNTLHSVESDMDKIIVSEDEDDGDEDYDSHSDSEMEEVMSNQFNVTQNNNNNPFSLVNDHKVDINTSPLQDILNIQVVKSHETNFANNENDNSIQQLTKHDLNNLTVTDLRKYIRQLKSDISSANIKKMKKNDLVEAIFQETHEDNESNTDSRLENNIEYDCDYDENSLNSN